MPTGFCFVIGAKFILFDQSFRNDKIWLQSVLLRLPIDFFISTISDWISVTAYQLDLISCLQFGSKLL